MSEKIKCIVAGSCFLSSQAHYEFIKKQLLFYLGNHLPNVEIIQGVESRGSLNMIQEAKNHNLIYRVYTYHL